MGIREELARLREDHGWTQAELADASGVPQTTISNIESGHTQHPRADTVRALAKAFAVSEEALWGDAVATAGVPDRGLREIAAIYEALPARGRTGLLHTARALQELAHRGGSLDDHPPADSSPSGDPEHPDQQST